MPSGDQIAKETIETLGYDKLNRKDVKKKFSILLEKASKTEFEIFKRYEYKCYKKILGYAVEKVQKGEIEKGETKKIVNKLLQLYKADYKSPVKFVNDFVSSTFDFMSILGQSMQQSRFTRSGGSFEKQLDNLFSYLFKGRYETQKIINGRADFIFPSVAAYKLQRGKTIIISLSRTLRERWRKAGGEMTPPYPQRFIATLEDNEKKISKDKVREMRNQGVSLVVYDRIKNSKKFKTDPTVYSYSQLVRQEIPNILDFWKSRNI